MASIRERSGCYFIDFRVDGLRYREQTSIRVSARNRRMVDQLVKKMEAEILLGSFDYDTYFPEGQNKDKFRVQQYRTQSGLSGPKVFDNFAETWFREKKVEWSAGYTKIVRSRLDRHLIPYFMGRELVTIDKASILEFRGHIADQPGMSGGTVTASCVNNIMLPLRQILQEAADRFNFPDPWKNIKQMKDRKKDIHPFSLDDVQLFLKHIRPDYHAYYTTRFFTGLRSGEIDGLQWKYVDFDRRQILVREALVQGRMTNTKTAGSDREVDMTSLVYDTLYAHRKKVGGRSDFVFSTASGSPLHNRNVTRRIWYPMLDILKLDKRRPYQTRHTAATLWLGAGENPEWIAKQMGHSSTKMLFQTYSRYVPNLTRQDGSAFERLLKEQFNTNIEAETCPRHDSTSNTLDKG